MHLGTFASVQSNGWGSHSDCDLWRNQASILFQTWDPARRLQKKLKKAFLKHVSFFIYSEKHKLASQIRN